MSEPNHPNYSTPEPPPQVTVASPPIWDLVIQDMRDRDAFGVRKYGDHLRGFNGRNALVDAYAEALDLVVYLRQALYELEQLAPRNSDVT